MQPIIDLHSSVYLTAISMKAQRRYEHPFDEQDRERPTSASLFAGIKSQLFLAISKMRKFSLKPQRELLAGREQRT